jgi:hypothetical protein
MAGPPIGPSMSGSTGGWSDVVKLCRIEHVVGRSRECPEGACPFWEPGGAVLEGGCVFDRLVVLEDPDLALWLLELRGSLEPARLPRQRPAGERDDRAGGAGEEQRPHDAEP